MSKKIIIGNWKMNPISLKEAESLFNKVNKGAEFKKTEVVICVPVIYLNKLKGISKKIKLGVQDIFYERVGPFTGNISGEMAYDSGARYVILGHSERRALGETSGEVSKKIRSAFRADLIPILCVGESARDENHEYFNVVKRQLEESLDGVPKNLISKMIIAYEPVWALSTTQGRRDATKDDSFEMALYLKKVLMDKIGVKQDLPRIIYGGSVNDKNALDFLRDGGVDGGLPGAASLDPKKFIKVIDIAESIS